MANDNIPTTLTGDACRSLEAIIREDLEHATISSTSVFVREDGQIILDELVLKLPDGRSVSVLPPDKGSMDAADMRLEVYDDRHGWREATVDEDYAEELADATHVWRPEPDTVEEARR